jgi:hypothetical protein
MGFLSSSAIQTRKRPRLQEAEDAVIQAHICNNNYPQQYTNPDFVRYSERVKGMSYSTVPRVLTKFVYVSPETTTQTDARVFKTNSLVLYVGDIKRAKPTKKSREIVVLRPNHVYQVIGFANKQHIALAIPGYTPTKARGIFAVTVSTSEVRHVSLQAQNLAIEELDRQKMLHVLQIIIRQRLNINTYNSIDNQKIYILHRLATEPSLLTALGITEKDPVTILNSPSLLDEVFGLFWENDPLRLVQHLELTNSY